LLSHERAQIAIVEDDAIMGESLLQRLTLEGYNARWWQTGAAAVAGLRERRADLIVCDIRLPDMSGEDVFQQVTPELVGSPVLFITAFGSIDQAVRLIRAGADDYLAKPFPMEEFLGRIEHLLQKRGDGSLVTAPVLGQSVAMRQVEATLRRVADIESTLLLTGESGVGKEVAARFMHQISRRAQAPFMAVNCAAIPANLLESELFGHERGAFTGAHARHEGYAERAREGVLFLDEITELPSPLQAKLLRLVQERAFFRVGGERPVPFRARLVCATNADLQARVRQGLFREDLFFRINVIAVDIPPLRERPDEIAALLRHYTAYFADALKSDVRGFTMQAEAVARTHRWPGNVRELHNRVERAVALAGGSWLDAADLFPDLVPRELVPDLLPSLANVVDSAQRQHIQAVLERTGGQLKKTAELLGISRTTLWEKMRKLGLATEGPDDVRES
jgi:DNA-binding NtrC family response regulator